MKTSKTCGGHLAEFEENRLSYTSIIQELSKFECARRLNASFKKIL